MAKFQAPDLSNATPEFLCDEMGKLSVVENYVKKLRGVYKEAFLARIGIKADEMLNGQTIDNSGEVFHAMTTRSDPVRIDQEKLKGEYPDVYIACLKSKPQLITRFSLKEGATNPIVNDLLTQMKQELDLD